LAEPLLRPFTALRPAARRAAEIAEPPYDVPTFDEALHRAAHQPWSFYHVSRPEIDFPRGTDPHSDAVYDKARDAIGRMIDDGVLVRDPEPRFYVYRMTMGDHVQTGVAGAAPMAAYETGRVRRHELTRPEKEIDRARQIEAVGAHTGPVFSIHRPNAIVEAVIFRATEEPAVADTTIDDVRHQVWVVDQTADIERLGHAFEAMDAIYIADGHHRSAAALRVTEARREVNPNAPADASWQHFLAISFPSDEVMILDYNRVVRDLGSHTVPGFLDEVDRHFVVGPREDLARPHGPGEFGMYLAGTWYHLTLRQSATADAPPLNRLDITLLTERLLAPVLGIGDPRTDDRIDFVGGRRGLAELERRVDSGDWAVAFALYPTSLDNLMAVADAGEVMPPKSTWFEPKLADGLLSLPLD